jgi:hypothetical protein
VTVRLRIVNGGSAIASVEDEEKSGVSLRSLKAFRIRCESDDRHWASVGAWWALARALIGYVTANGVISKD